MVPSPQGPTPGPAPDAPPVAEAAEAPAAGDGATTFETVWHYPIAHVEGSPITVGAIVLGVALLALSFVLSRVLASAIGRQLSRRARMHEGAAAAIQSVAFYVMLAVFGLSALRITGVPLTAFTIVGGALAIGVGIGSQQIFNNFISGLVLHVERPVRVGDLIQVGDLFGNVERIGARSTRVRTGSNVLIVVPNSAFLEQNVVNWTLNDPTVRTHVAVGVAYGSPTDRVTELLLRAASEVEGIHGSPEPFVLFDAFGNDSLQFELHFWVSIRRAMDRRRIESEVRYRIDAHFREAGVVIAFPQRDVHLDAARPLEVRVVPGEPAAAS